MNDSENLVVQREPQDDSSLIKTEPDVLEDDRLKAVVDVVESVVQPQQQQEPQQQPQQQQQQVLPSARVYLTSTSRQNLETIVEAIRHLEGDHLFSDDHQDAPLALTKHAAASNQKLLKVHNDCE